MVCWHIIDCPSDSDSSSSKSSDSGCKNATGITKFVCDTDYSDFILVGGIAGIPLGLELLSLDLLPLPRPILVLSSVGFLGATGLMAYKVYVGGIGNFEDWLKKEACDSKIKYFPPVFIYCEAMSGAGWLWDKITGWL